MGRSSSSNNGFVGKNHDPEMGGIEPTSLINDVVQNYAWRNMNVQVKDRVTGDALSILADTNGIVHAGEIIAIMGPSGSGKTTLLNAIAHRAAAAKATTTGDRLANGQVANLQRIRDLSSYVEQDDALIGSLTVRETVDFAAGLSLPSSFSKTARLRRVDDLIASFGLQDQSQTIVGTPIKKGLSGGQKKRLGVCSRLVTDPKILFLDEPTSGLDSTLSYEVMNYIKKIGRENNLIIIASIHQPSTATFTLFDKLFLLSRGKTCYFGSISEARGYFDRIGYTMPSEVNPAEFFLDLINTDLVKEGDDVVARVKDITAKWLESSEAANINQEIDAVVAKAHVPGSSVPQLSSIKVQKPDSWTIPLVLLQRSWIKSYRDIVAYGIRIIMYLGLAILMGTVFLRFSPTQEYIQSYINAIFFSSAFMSFMAVAYVPAYLEDQATFVKERANGIVGPFSFMLSNFIIGLPFLFLITLLFSVVEYWLTGFRASGTGFMTFIMWLFLDLVAAESLVVLVSSVFPVFVVALAVTAFSNGLWMCVNGFLVPITILNVFWKYVFHYIDYQAYVFQGMMVNEFKYRTYSCATSGEGQYQCSYPSSLNSGGLVAGVDVLRTYDINPNVQGMWVGIMVAIIAVYRLLGYLALRFKL
ncbi:putative ATP-binding cassette transporter [Talaromyces proteolyticus]|uniref:ATP-binding cassette transporter n=1 Tax=Talaromyces proteolyticus TaxID=1131652 RepID=A0AAD4Q2P0_9EURO|nr:putative ATP-binding cassette transporter [Talaromyces proteolyticus]KAH8700538.1 putative ATP-binding cassette transporter [Talaromyces proteolyticus]